MSKRVCNVPGCPTLTDGGRCTEHRREAEQARGTRQARGYDAGHDAIRRHWAPHVASGRIDCWRCGKPIRYDEPWDLGHDDGRTRHLGPEHQACNRSAPRKRDGA